ncbi:MAG TPA: formylglycine-generating enzyme family protein [Terriglobales bacterium]
MRTHLVRTAMIAAVILTTLAATASEVPVNPADTLVLVQGGAFQDTKSNYYDNGVTVSSFYIARYDVTQKEWADVMGNNPSKFRGDNLPVEMVSWYDAVEYCNRRSIKEGLKPYYNIDKNAKDPNNKPDPHFGDLDDVKWTVTINPTANGYRLPTEAEWEYAASGGQLSQSYMYSGSNNIEDVAWYWRNSGDQELDGFWFWQVIERNHDQTKPVGSKKPNELGLYDMSGNVREWCWDWFGDLKTHVKDPKGNPSGFGRVWRGGGWMGAAFCCESTFRSSLAANGKGPDQGFRVCRNK